MKNIPRRNEKNPNNEGVNKRKATIKIWKMLRKIFVDEIFGDG